MSIGEKEIREARVTYDKYKAGKKKLEDRIVDNETWFRMQHWRDMRPKDKYRRQTGWLLAAIVNKHADFMDNMPEVNVLAREQSDEQTAQTLTEILPVVLERAQFKKAYSSACYDKTKFGAGIYGVMWDSRMEHGLGNVRINRVDALNLTWEPGVEDIQQSRNLFYTEMVSHETLKEMYPDIKDLEKRLNAPAETEPQYRYTEYKDRSGQSMVFNWYYRKKCVLHYCRFVQDILLFASENEEGYEDGWYRHGLYPFVFDPMFPEPETPHGFGIIDAMRDTQEDIDQLNDLIMQNAKVAVRRRYFVRQDAQVNEQEYADFDRDFVHYQGNLNENSLKEIANEPMSGTYYSVLQGKIDELKENSFNRDISNGGSAGTTTAAGIATLAENSSKSSRDAIQATYRAFQQIVEMVIELIRQFYDVPRVFRIVGDDKAVRYETFDNSAMTGSPISGIGMDFGEKEPVFDLDIKVSKANAWSRQAQNQDIINFYGMGFFAPNASTQALACLEVLELDNKDKLIETIKKNGLKEQFAAQFLPMLIQSCADPAMAAAAMQAAQAAGLIEAQPQEVPGGGAPQKMADTDVNGQMRHSSNYMDKQREIAAARTAPQNV